MERLEYELELRRLFPSVRILHACSGDRVQAAAVARLLETGLALNRRRRS